MEKLGFSRNSYKIWPEIKVKKVPKDHPGFKKYGERQKEIEEEKNLEEVLALVFLFQIKDILLQTIT